MIAPLPVQDVQAGRLALRRDLELLLKGGTLAERGWAQPDDLTLLVPLFGGSEDKTDQYLLRLVFDHYPKYPPSAQFVNPLTGTYTPGADAMWIPRSEGHSAIAFHVNYSGRQLICSSTTLEFYLVQHEVAKENIWAEGRMTFMSTIAAIRAAMVTPFYKGRSNA